MIESLYVYTSHVPEPNRGFLSKNKFYKVLGQSFSRPIKYNIKCDKGNILNIYIDEGCHYLDQCLWVPILIQKDTYRGTVKAYFSLEANEGTEIEIKELRHLIDVFPFKCDYTGRGMYKGWFLDDVAFSDLSKGRDKGKAPRYLTEHIEKEYHLTPKDFWRMVSEKGLDTTYYWEIYDSIEDCFSTVYLEDGTVITEIKDNIFTDGKGNLYKIVENAN